ncbi:putative carbohydrate-binding protein with CBM5 and CBM33 domain [Streptomyces umbrinus]|uniref:Carbohydrate-binding protein with CBM5 and CBM33 domain n=1 Tax=Streptomyces umbrinus TaxID=67370 RepID=A0ABU0T7K8_9ACTN|nr:putative carbohydrate-binding protein with CBM5 and CBM33 domain [Streptomyces umbrinus]
MIIGYVGRSRKRLRFHRLFALLGAVLLALAVASLPSPAAAHGVAMGPGSRTYLCYLDLLQNESTQMPSNPACRAAVQGAGTTPLYNWFAVLDSNAGGRSVGYVPDGKLCSAGDRSPYNFSPYNAARTDWPKTHLTSGSSIQINYSNWAHHPGKFEVYITKNGWSPTTPLAWGDLTHLQTVTDPPQTSGPGSVGGHYYWDLRLPARSGPHMLFVQWIRSDSNENFFSCSDVAFDGGQGEVTGLGGGRTTADAIAAKAADSTGIQAAAAHTGHGTHAAAAPDVDAVNAAGEATSGSPLTALAGSLAGAAVLVACVAGAAFHRGRRRPQADARP